jgi:hypothetical protein
MIKILITATSFEGTVTVTYGEYGMMADTYPPLLHLDFSAAVLTDRQKQWLKEVTPVRYGETEIDERRYTWLEQWGGAREKLRFVVEEADLDFDRDFWNIYDNKQNRIRAEREWKKLSNAQRSQAVAGIHSYFRYLNQVTFRSKMMPDRYLKEKQWTTDWSKL